MSQVMLRPGAKSIGMSGRQGRKKQSLLTAAAHNLRAIQQELGADSHIDASRMCLNEILAGPDTPRGVDELALALRAGIGFTPNRDDFVQAHEMLFTLPTSTTLDTSIFFRFCLDFVTEKFGRENILSAVLHRDEAAPHLHILILPIVDGRYAGSALITKPSLAALIDKFAADVLAAFDVKVMTKLAGAARSKVTQVVLDQLGATLEPLVSGALLDAILKAAGRNPAPFMAALGITLPGLENQVGDGGKEFRRIALSTGKGGKKERAVNPIGFDTSVSDGIQKPHGFEMADFDDVTKPYGIGTDPASDLEKHRNHPCVVSPQSHPRSRPTQVPGDEAPEPASSATPAPRLGRTEQPAPAPATLHAEHQDDVKSMPPGSAGAGFVHQVNTPSVSAADELCEIHDDDAGLRKTEGPSMTSNVAPRVKAGLIRMVHDLDDRDLEPGNMSGDAINCEQGMIKELTRERDSDYQAEQWSEALGEFISAPPPPRAARQAAQAWVTASLATLAAHNKTVDE